MSRTRVTGADVERAVAVTARALRAAPAEAWGNRAGPMEENCWDALDHLNNGLFSYALRMAPPVPYVKGRPTILWERPGEPSLPIATDRAAGPGAGIEVLLMMGGLVAAVTDARPSSARSDHVWGRTDPEGFAAMGVVETLAHAFDLTEGLGVPFTPPGDLAAVGLARLFPEAPTDADPWATLLWATGRGDLDGHGRRGPDWSWHSAPLDE
ncbi:hypothetical protein [Glycomyces harbinensis]|uniref:Mycothiol maleylpyruvate isomerase N-terminal domain-containing protein n=1 Tax=Glycomyces harbinensis TaxID=58114 RepID=A0A1G7DTU1_9ACTN|nr:hypothetical protein [Glycomyces harbinensis]SDE54893.1 hypothetical protein SAMN05216270_12837 [Glycomyces harbinensis]